MVNVSRLIDTDYLKGYEMYQEESSNLEVMLYDDQPELAYFSEYNDIQLIGISLRCIFKASERLRFFQNFAMRFLQKGMYVFLCMSILVVTYCPVCSVTIGLSV